MIPFSTSSPKPVRAASSKAQDFPIIDAPSINFDERKRPVRFVMLHYTGMDSEIEALNLLRGQNVIDYNNENKAVSTPTTDMQSPPIPKKIRRVSSHYVVFSDGTIYKLVDENKRAWHAGAGSYAGETDMNSASIGIEICNAGHDFGLPDFPNKQIEAVMWLVEGIKQRHGLDKHHIIGHSDWAPKRKLDPGEKFPWHRFEKRGISLSIPKGKEDGDLTILASQIGENNDFINRVQKALKAIGYGIEINGIYDDATKIIIIAFQRRFRQNNVSGVLDVETLGKAERLARKVLPA